MYMYHNVVRGYSGKYMKAPAYVPAPAAPYLKDVVTNLVERSISRPASASYFM